MDGFQQESLLIFLALLFGLALAVAEHEGPSWTFDWSFLISLAVCLFGGLLVGRWWALAVPIVVETALGVLDGGVALPFADPYFLLAVAVGIGLRRAGASLVGTCGRVRIDWATLAGLTLYVGSAVGFTLLALLESFDSFDGLLGLALAVLAVVHLAAGFAIGRWFALFLPVLLIVLSIPVPTDPDAYEPIPLWWATALWLAPIGAGLLAVGVGARRLTERQG